MGFVYKDDRLARAVWAVAYKDVDGTLRRERTKASNRTLARRILADREDAVERAKVQKLTSVRELNERGTPLSLRQFTGEYMDHVEASLAPKTALRYQGAFDVHILPKLGRFGLRQLKPGDVQRYADARLRSKAAPRTVLKEMMILSGMYREAMKRELVSRNPVSLTDKPATDKTIVRYLDPHEEQPLLAFAPEPLRAAIIVAIHSGLRQGEETSLTWTNVHFDERRIIVRRTKSKKDRVVPMNPTLFETLKAIPRHISSPYVFTNADTGDKFDRFNNTAWRKALRRAGIRNFRWHDLRHTFGSRLAQAGVAITSIRELMGHGSIEVTMRYAHMSPSNLREAVMALEGPGRDGTNVDENTTRMTTHRPKDRKTGTLKTEITRYASKG